VFPEVIVGMIEASITRRRATPRTFRLDGDSLVIGH